MMRNHLSYKAGALFFVLVRPGIIGVRGSRVFTHGNVDVVRSILIGNCRFTVDSLFAFLTCVENETLKHYQVAFPKSLQESPIRWGLARLEMQRVFLRLGIALKRRDFGQHDGLGSP